MLPSMALSYSLQLLKGDRCGVSSNTAFFTKEQTWSSSLLGNIGNQSVLSRTGIFVFFNHFTEGRNYTISLLKSKILLWGLWPPASLDLQSAHVGTWLLFCVSMFSGRWLILWGLSRIWCFIWGGKINHATDFFGFAYTMSAEYPAKAGEWGRPSIFFF